MIKRINSKGFTLVELLATILILGLISSVTIVTITTYYEKSKEKSEEVFIRQLENTIDDYISLEGTRLSYTELSENLKLKETGDSVSYNNEFIKKCYIENTIEQCDKARLYKADNSSQWGIGTISNYFTNKQIKNPATEVECTNANTSLTIYRDSDYVFCFTIKSIGDSSCITDTISTCEDLYKYNDKGYITFK